MQPSNPLYFIALVPPPSIYEEVTAFKQYAAQHFDSGHALSSPPHITLIPPFRWPENQYTRLRTSLTNFRFRAPSFSIKLLHFSSFPPRVIFIDVAENTALISLQKQLAQHFVQQLDIQHKSPFGFHPHMTVAFRDLKKEVFPKAWAHFSEQTYQRVFSVDQLALLQHDGKKWQIQANFSLES